MRLGKAACAAALFGTVAALSVFAHPHVFINNTMTVVFAGGTLKGMSFRWVFDDMFPR